MENHGSAFVLNSKNATTKPVGGMIEMSCTVLAHGKAVVVYVCSPSWERWAELMYMEELAKRAEQEIVLDHERELSLEPFEIERDIEMVEIELLPEVQRWC